MDILKKLNKYLKSNLETPRRSKALYREAFMDYECAYAGSSIGNSNIDNYIEENKNDDKFQKLLFSYIDSKSLKDSDVYNKVDIDRRLFSKIRNDNYHPSKNTIILLGLSLELKEEEIEKLLESASYSLPKNNTRDLILRFCFIEKIYDYIKVNELLDNYNEELLN